MSIRFDQQHENAAANGNENGNGNGNAGEAPEEAVEAEKTTGELVLPKALEDVLALKDQRAAEFTVDADSLGGSGGVTQDGDEADVGEDSEDDGENQVNGAGGGKPGKLLFASDLASSASDLQAADTKSEEPADIKNIDFFSEFRAACEETV